MMNLIVAFRNFSKAPKNQHFLLVQSRLHRVMHNLILFFAWMSLVFMPKYGGELKAFMCQVKFH